MKRWVLIGLIVVIGLGSYAYLGWLFELPNEGTIIQDASLLEAKVVQHTISDPLLSVKVAVPWPVKSYRVFEKNNQTVLQIQPEHTLNHLVVTMVATQITSLSEFPAVKLRLDQASDYLLLEPGEIDFDTLGSSQFYLFQNDVIKEISYFWLDVSNNQVVSLVESNYLTSQEAQKNVKFILESFKNEN